MVGALVRGRMGASAGGGWFAVNGVFVLTGATVPKPDGGGFPVVGVEVFGAGGKAVGVPSAPCGC